jgi:hypothetical protein
MLIELAGIGGKAMYKRVSHSIFAPRRAADLTHGLDHDDPVDPG